MLNAVGTGFYVTEQFRPEQLREMPLERKAAALAEVIRLVLEPPGEPDPGAATPPWDLSELQEQP